jgi:hypothetical protein
MSCDNCLYLKIANISYDELVSKWNALYHPMNITEGYQNRYLRESQKSGKPLGETKLRFIYCDMGLLNRFYIVRSSKTIRVKTGLDHCSSYK